MQSKMGTQTSKYTKKKKKVSKMAIKARLKGAERLRTHSCLNNQGQYAENNEDNE